MLRVVVFVSAAVAGSIPLLSEGDSGLPAVSGTSAVVVVAFFGGMSSMKITINLML
jgi:hypothetical protein